MRWKAPTLQRGVPHRKYLLRARSTENLVMELNRLFSLTEMVLVFQNETRPNLSPSTLIGSFGRELEGLGLSQGGQVGFCR